MLRTTEPVIDGVEDDPDDRRVIHAWLNEQNIAADYIDVDSEAGFVRAVKEESFDIILSDKCLQEYDGIQALQFARAHVPHVPFVFVTGYEADTIDDRFSHIPILSYAVKYASSRLSPAWRAS